MTLTATRRAAPCSACKGRASLQQVAKRIGFRVHRVSRVRDVGSSPDHGAYWNGKRLVAQHPVEEADLAHEIGHWLAARPPMRKWKNYGLVRGDQDDSPRGRSQDSSQREEERACRLGFALLLLHGWPKRRLLGMVLRDYSWWHSGESASDAIRRGLRHLWRLDRTSHLFSPENTIRCCECGAAESLGETTKEKAK